MVVFANERLFAAIFATRIRSTREVNFLTHVSLAVHGGGGGYLPWIGSRVPSLDGGDTYPG